MPRTDNDSRHWELLIEVVDLRCLIHCTSTTTGNRPVKSMVDHIDDSQIPSLPLRLLVMRMIHTYRDYHEKHALLDKVSTRNTHLVSLQMDVDVDVMRNLGFERLNRIMQRSGKFKESRDCDTSAAQ